MTTTPAAPTGAVSTDTAVVRALRRIRVPQTQRNRELVLLVFAFAINAGAVALVQLGALGAIDWTFLVYCGGLTALVVALHIVLRLRARAADPFVVPIATLLTGLGLAMIYRIDIALKQHGWEAASTRQLAWAGIALVLAIAVVVFLRNYRVLFRYTYLSGLAGILLLLLPIVPGLGTNANADVWVSLGFFSFQPGEIAKILLAVFFAGYLVRTRESLTSVGTRFLGLTWPRARELGPLVVIWLVSLGIIVLQRDLGTGLLIFGMFVAMLYVATGKTSWVLIGVVLAALGAFLASRVLPYVGGRFANWLDAFNPEVIGRQGGSYQLVQGIFGLAQGGLVGTGLGQGRPYITPLSQSDYILPSLGEELGLIGVFAILCLYMVFASRGIRIGLAGQDDFGKLLATGLSFIIALQVFIMVGGVTRVIPLTGLTTPFLAAGGSSLVANWIIVALLLRISDAVRSRPRVVIGYAHASRHPPSPAPRAARLHRCTETAVGGRCLGAPLQSRGRAGEEPVTKELRRLSILMLFMFLALFISTSWIQVVNADVLAQNPDNTRARYDSYEVQRGSIIVSGSAIASSVSTPDVYQWQRVYIDAPIWDHVTGWFNPALGSTTGIEQAMNRELSGTAGPQFFSRIERIITGQPPRGSNVVLTLDAGVQRAAYDALGALQGAVVAIDPATGRVLAMVSSPGFDTNLLAAHDASAVNSYYDQLVADPTNPLFDRTIGGDLNPPGSTFKLVVASAALASGDYTPESTLPNLAAYQLPQSSAVVSNASGGTCGPGEQVSIADALRLSCNIPFAQLAVELGDTAIREEAEKYGFNTSFELPLVSTPSSYPRALDDPQTALTGFGQGQVTATPLQMAMVSAGIANGGMVMNPHMVDRVIGPDLSVQQTFDDSEFGRALDRDLAAEMMAMMVANVSDGAASGATIDGVEVGGKTGTAENGSGKPYTLWFTGFAPADDPQVAVAVVVEDGGGQGQSGSGNTIAAPIAKKVMEAVLGR